MGAQGVCSNDKWQFYFWHHLVSHTSHIIGNLLCQPGASGNGDCPCKEEVEKEEAEALAKAMEVSEHQSPTPVVPGLTPTAREEVITIRIQPDVSLPLSICLSVCLPIWLAGHLSVWLPICLAGHLSVWLPICLSAHLSGCPSVCLPICLSGHLSVWPSVCLAGHLCVCLSIAGFMLTGSCYTSSHNNNKSTERVACLCNVRVCVCGVSLCVCVLCFCALDKGSRVVACRILVNVDSHVSDCLQWWPVFKNRFCCLINVTPVWKIYSAVIAIDLSACLSVLHICHDVFRALRSVINLVSIWTTPDILIFSWHWLWLWCACRTRLAAPASDPATAAGRRCTTRAFIGWRGRCWAREHSAPVTRPGTRAPGSSWPSNRSDAAWAWLTVVGCCCWTVLGGGGGGGHPDYNYVCSCALTSHPW